MENLSIDQAKTVRQGEELNLERLSEFLRGQLPGATGEITVQQFPSGFSNLTYLLSVGGQEYVLRRPPFGANIKSAHDMAREYNLLSAVIKAWPRVPKPLLYSNDESIIGAEFYIMERVKGVILRNQLPAGMAEKTMRAISETTIDNLGAIHAIDIHQNGLHLIGKPEGYVKRQVEGWIQRYRNAETEPIEDMNTAAEWLPANLSAEQPAALIHNDYKYDNVVLRPGTLDEIIAVLDWEMATVGDPLMDLGTSLAYWADQDSPEVLRSYSLTAFPGNLNRQQVVERYAAQSGRDVSGIVFYYVFGCFKVAVIAQQIYARFKKGLTQDKRFAHLIYLVRACAQNAANAIRYNRIGNFS